MDIGVSCEERNAEEEFCEDEAHRPDVDGGAVGFGTEEEFGRAVPTGDDVAGHAAVGVGEGAGETKIAEFENAAGGD